jgi:hypothetical protein
MLIEFPHQPSDSSKSCVTEIGPPVKARVGIPENPRWNRRTGSERSPQHPFPRLVHARAHDVLTTMPKLSMHPTSTGPDGLRRWVVQTLPDDFQDGDLFPSPRSDDFLGTKEEARAELKRRSSGKPDTSS